MDDGQQRSALHGIALRIFIVGTPLGVSSGGCPVIAELILVTVLADSQNSAFDDAYRTALQLCVTLAPENADQLGDVIPAR